MSTPYKMIFAVRDDIKMSRGKTAAQVGHAAIECYIAAKTAKPKWVSEWKASGAAKICLRVTDDKHALEIFAAATAAGLSTVQIIDAGHTELMPGTLTVVGIGPAPSFMFDSITGSLKLLS